MQMGDEGCGRKEDVDPRDISEQRATRDWEEHGGFERKWESADTTGTKEIFTASHLLMG